MILSDCFERVSPIDLARSKAETILVRRASSQRRDMKCLKV